MLMVKLPPRTIDETGHRYGRLLVIEYAGTEACGNARWLCQCDCGARMVSRGKRLRQGKTVSCGCWRADPAVRQAARMKVPASVRQAIARAGGLACKH